MTTNPPEEADVTEETTEPAVEEPGADESISALAERVAVIAGSEAWTADFGNAKVLVDRSRWVEAVDAVRDGAGLDFFSFLPPAARSHPWVRARTSASSTHTAPSVTS